MIHLGTGTSMPSQFLQEWYGSFSFPSGVFELPTNNYGTYDSSIFQSRGVLAEAQYSQNVMRVGRHPWNHLFHFLEITLLLRLAWESFLICNNTWSELLLLYSVGVSDRGVLNQLVNLFCVLPIPDGDAKRHKVYTGSGNQGPTSSLRDRSCNRTDQLYEIK